MPSGIGKHKSHQSSKRKGYYEQQKFVTARNKFNRSQRVQRRKKVMPKQPTAENTIDPMGHNPHNTILRAKQIRRQERNRNRRRPIEKAATPVPEGKL